MLSLFATAAIFPFFDPLVGFSVADVPDFTVVEDVTGTDLLGPDLLGGAALTGLAVAWDFFGAGFGATTFFAGLACFAVFTGLRDGAGGFLCACALAVFCGLRAGAFLGADGFFTGTDFFATGFLAAAAAGLRLEFAMSFTIVPRRSRVIA
ncbi:MAG: hypothetical protein P4L92_02240 [Rudaea sp.]|nr:hypothetical protein [Rudaea sp.]